jgi:hypothetical protein
MMKSSNITPYSDIESFEDLRNEKMRLSYEVRIAKRKIDVAVMELSSALSPVRLLSNLLAEWMQPISAGIKQWLEGFFSRQNR